MNMEGSHFKVKSFCEKRHDNSKIALNLKKMYIFTVVFYTLCALIAQETQKRIAQ